MFPRGLDIICVYKIKQIQCTHLSTFFIYGLF